MSYGRSGGNSPFAEARRLTLLAYRVLHVDQYKDQLPDQIEIEQGISQSCYFIPTEEITRARKSL